jgi:ABC-type tungstate transport system permease subunit
MVALAGLAATLVLSVSDAPADTAGTVRILGPSDVVDSGLFANVIEPQFEQAFPQYELTYSGSAQKAAKENAEAGAGQPSVLMLHEPRLEAEFVAGGFSDENHLGNALFYGDYVLVGTTGDAAGVASGGGTHDIARGFAAVAAAGVAGDVTYVSRGGTTNAPATTLEEHTIWKLVSESGLVPAGVMLCDVSAADGGGMTPITAAAFASDPEAPDCPAADSGIVTGSDLPSWYEIANMSQANELSATNSCIGVPVGSAHCYTLTDRGTYAFLATGKAPSGSVGNLSILSADQSPSAPAGATALLTRFHGYVINPAKAGETVNLQGAQDLIGFLTSPAEQAQIALYLKSAPGSPGAPFTPDAAPQVTATPSAASVAAGSPVIVNGGVADPEPGYPGLAGQQIFVQATGGAPLASSLLDAGDRYSVSFVPPASGSYEVTTPEISRLVEPAAAPPFGDLLTPAASVPFALSVTTAAPTSPGPAPAPISIRHTEIVRIEKVRTSKGRLIVSGELSPASTAKGTISLLVKRLGAPAPSKKHRRSHDTRIATSKTRAKKLTFKKLATKTVAAGATKVTIAVKLPRGLRYAVELNYAARGQSTVKSAPKRVRVP